MRFAEQANDTARVIQGYGNDWIRIARQDYRASLVVSARRIVTDWGAEAVDALTSQQIDLLVAERPQVIIIGTGAIQRFPGPGVHAALLSHGIGVEIMDTGAACRTYNVLVGEGRHVVAGLILDLAGA